MPEPATPPSSASSYALGSDHLWDRSDSADRAGWRVWTRFENLEGTRRHNDPGCDAGDDVYGAQPWTHAYSAPLGRFRINLCQPHVQFAYWIPSGLGDVSGLLDYPDHQHHLCRAYAAAFGAASPLCRLGRGADGRYHAPEPSGHFLYSPWK
jgi:hypothetical protein